MKLFISYFNQKAKKIFDEQVDDEGNKRVVVSSFVNFVSKDEIILKVVDVNQPDEAKKFIDPGYSYYNVLKYFNLKKGYGVYYDEMNKAFKAEVYGFVVIDHKQTLRIIPPLQINKEKTVAHFMVAPTKFKKLPLYSEISELMTMNSIVAVLGESKVSESLKEINLDEMKVHQIIVAKSKEPVNGRREYFEPIVNIDKKAGKVLADGSIDYKEVDSIIQITKNEEILKRYPEIKPANGFDIYGNKIPAEMELPKGYQRGENIVQSYNDPEIFVSGIDGCLEINKKVISVKSIAVINGDVDYESGNIDFNGSVHVKGAVLPGFIVKANGDVVIEKNVDDGVIEATGSVSIKMGVAGKGNAKIKAGENVKSKYILNAEIEADGYVVIDDSIINSKVFSNNYISVISQHGKIMGGEIIARNYIEVNTCGSPKETITTLIVGKNLILERELQQLRKEMQHYNENVKDIMAQIQQNFGSSLFEDPKKFIAVLPTVKKKQCIELLSNLSKNNKTIKSLAAKGKEIEEKLVFEKEPYIIVKEKVYRGSTVQIKKLVRKVEEDIVNAKFYEDLENKVIKFVAAV